MDEMNNELSEFKELRVGDKVQGKVVKVEEKQVLVDIGYKVDGIIPISEISSLHIEKTSDAVSEGDELTLSVKKVEDDEVILSKRAIDADLAWEELQQKFESGEIFEAEVKDVVKGGLVVDVGLRGFIPASLVETHYVEDFEPYKGQKLSLKVVEIEKDQNRVILSHRAVVEADEANKKQEVFQSIQEGQIVEGKVQRITNFGVFVDIGGIDGLVHISQLSHEHVEKASDVVSEGEQIKVKVLSVDRDNERISLSLKETQPGPWENIEERVQVGAILDGTVKRLVNFGAFVEVLPGVEGLVHISQISTEHIGTPQEVLSVGQQVQVKVLDVNEREKRISLSMKEIEMDQNQEELKQYEREEEHSGFQLGDMIGDKLNKYK
ncbi:30S ribosomal protein S1 [Aquibacillus koreensis]|uniref:30S ribosomal protein S1 n=1 Tax=Aquibacillus koreensis TaxID=279446 RepID=A0A9X3WKM8_9BACI|nr:30S ribosomal protein S1 [Aquibacillus koreensis]MCT2537400.1 30S ribosomal protein S1 [Aquibacillus koreensis]MDC3418846.1 30S ribosomal protein S1 [Aquibacillus koreensis]